MNDSILPQPVQQVIDDLGRLPGIGPKTAARLTFHLLRQSKARTQQLSRALLELKEKVIFCENCFNISETPVCHICSSPKRDHSLICVVSEPLDALAIEKTREFKGVYHVLNGEMSPIDGIGPDQLKVKELENRLKDQTIKIKELILATNPTTEGETTALYLAKLAEPYRVKVTRLAHGIPIGGDIEYADEVTLMSALAHRTAFTA
ncbi:recombination protein RecR [Candidatus Wirthbacteria bacterium CG2_30_54_11]|uniref:Recombination protein RecR n=1 Tax=Candidatus Wirthbacteria bacterium CG2_30_54_11 TaxID=1817892 RepID=A0A1J5J6L0_9BACT|nr:MAG: recombination protein RecR [Candidatus Wirthbacteria bacterium CG2_30_54_11]